MINTKETLKKLHKKFPLMTLDELFEILECYVEESLSTWSPGKLTTQPWTGEKIWYNTDTVTCTTNPATKIGTVEGNITAKY